METNTPCRAPWLGRLEAWLAGALTLSIVLVAALGMIGVPMTGWIAIRTTLLCVPLVLCTLLIVRFWIDLMFRRLPALSLGAKRSSGRIMAVATLAVALTLILSRERVLPRFYDVYSFRSESEFSLHLDRNTSTITDLKVKEISDGQWTEPTAKPPSFEVRLHPHDAESAAIIREQMLANCPADVRLGGTININAQFSRLFVPLYKKRSQAFSVRCDLRFLRTQREDRIGGKGTGTHHHQVVGLMSSAHFREHQATSLAEFLIDHLVGDTRQASSSRPTGPVQLRSNPR